MTITIAGTNPLTGEKLSAVTAESSHRDVDRIVDLAHAAAGWLRDQPRSARATLLSTLADALEAHREELVCAADEETGLGRGRLGGELTRTVFQLRFFGEVITEGSYLEATIDHAADTAMGPRPDLRRMLTPTGVVAVFGASNFPFAFSVPGGDTASALAAGCPVVVKAHSSHPATSLLAWTVMSEAAQRFGAPEGLIGIVFGQKAGITLVSHPYVTAVGFTGSLSGGEALNHAIAQRPNPIPFYGELSSINPVIVSEAAAAERAQDIGAGIAGSIAGSAGQLCTKPGVVFVPRGQHGDAVVQKLAADLRTKEIPPLLNRRIFESYTETTGRLASVEGIREVVEAARPEQGGFHVPITVFEVQAEDFSDGTAQEVFGPSMLVVRYAAYDEMPEALAALENSLTATIHLGQNEPDVAQALTHMLLPMAGRILYNGYPTGLAVSWAQTHGGPWPSTNSLHTSVGATAIRRFLRPVTWQNAPEEVLPEELRDAGGTLPRRIDGILTLPA
ncbi:aldehyde dehydrogenase (NADP(+)) [Arthrobacter tecti]